MSWPWWAALLGGYVLVGCVGAAALDYADDPLSVVFVLIWPALVIFGLIELSAKAAAYILRPERRRS